MQPSPNCVEFYTKTLDKNDCLCDIFSALLWRYEEQLAGLSHTGNVPAGAEFLTPTPTTEIIHIKEHLSQAHSYKTIDFS